MASDDAEDEDEDNGVGDGDAADNEGAAKLAPYAYAPNVDAATPEAAAAAAPKLLF